MANKTPTKKAPAYHKPMYEAVDAAITLRQEAERKNDRELQGLIDEAYVALVQVRKYLDTHYVWD